MRHGATLVTLLLIGMLGILAGCGGGGSSGPSGFFGYFPEPDDTDLPRDAVFAVAAPERAVGGLSLYRWEDRDDDLRAYGRELARVRGRRYYDLDLGEHIFVPDNTLRAFTRYLLVTDYIDGSREVWAIETGDWVSGRGAEVGIRRWQAPARDAELADAAGPKKSWRTQ